MSMALQSDSILARPNVRWLTALLALAMAVAGALVATPSSAQSLPDFTELVEKVGPAVVNIRTLERNKTASRSGNGAPEMDEDMLEFFRRFGLPIPGQPNQPVVSTEAQGEMKEVFGLFHLFLDPFQQLADGFRR